MKTHHLIAAAVLSAAGMTVPGLSFAAVSATHEVTGQLSLTAPAAVHDDTGLEVAEKGRGRGRGGDRARDDDRRERSERRERTESRERSDDRASGRSRPRIPGGSGCDDAGDIAEHPACSGGATGGTGAAPGVKSGGGHGGRPRIPGGSGCDDPQDVIEHPECRV